MPPLAVRPRWEVWRTPATVTPSPPTRARAVGEETVDGIINGIDEGVDQQHEGELPGGHPQSVHVVDGRIGFLSMLTGMEVPNMPME